MKTQKLFTKLAFGLFIITLLMACKSESTEKSQAKSAPEESALSSSKTAICFLSPTEGNATEGKVVFTETDEGIHVSAHVTGLSEGKHGFHIHEFGDCSAPDGTSAGGHFNPRHMPHGAPDVAARHVGDLGNLDANAEGIARLEYTDSLLSFEGENSIIGRSIIVHADADDLMSQPTGNAGARVACGIIELEQ